MTNAPSPVFGFLKNPSMVDYPGYLSAVFFTSGCNFTCGFCHNAELLNHSQEGISWMKLDEACRHFKANWVDGAVISGGEPTLRPELPELIRFLKSYGFKIKLDTNGSTPKVLKSIIKEVDYIAMDIKCAPADYPALTGYNHPEIIAESIEIIKQSNTDYEFRTTIIEGFHTDAKLNELAKMVEGCKRYIVQAFIPRDNLPNMELIKLPRTSKERLIQIAKALEPFVGEMKIRSDQLQ